MKLTLFTFVCLIPSTTCALTAAYLCHGGVEGWGWFLIVALLMWAVPASVGANNES